MKHRVSLNKREIFSENNCVRKKEEIEGYTFELIAKLNSLNLDKGSYFLTSEGDDFLLICNSIGWRLVYSYNEFIDKLVLKYYIRSKSSSSILSKSFIRDSVGEALLLYLMRISNLDYDVELISFSLPYFVEELKIYSRKGNNVIQM